MPRPAAASPLTFSVAFCLCRAEDEGAVPRYRVDQGLVVPQAGPSSSIGPRPMLAGADESVQMTQPSSGGA
uniref:Secreted protein n=1 Tax=Triticum urartu TaxID=4572 RepID=A0A8R7UW42_TRIUA